MKQGLQACHNVQPTSAVPIYFPDTIPSFPTTYLRIFVLFICILLSKTFFAQPANDYKKMIGDRVAKIVNTLHITDSAKYKKVSAIMADQYYALNDIQDKNKAAVTAIKAQSMASDAMAESLKEEEKKMAAGLKDLHASFIAHLNEQLTEDQLEKVKDGMTYRILPITYSAYLDEVPTLKTEEKEQIYTWLKEARESAMDAGSSNKKHEVFGKYKGRINNYLSAHGYDMKKEGEEWQKRIKEKKSSESQTKTDQ